MMTRYDYEGEISNIGIKKEEVEMSAAGERGNRKKFIQYLIGIEHHKLSGCFTVKRDAGEDRYYFIKGIMTHVENNEEENASVKNALGMGFLYKKTRFFFQQYSHLDTLSDELLPQQNLVDYMWSGIQKHIPQTDIFKEINSVPREELQLSKPIAPLSYHNDAVKELFSLLQSPQTLTALNEKMSKKWSNFCSYGDLYRIMWLLFQSNSFNLALPFLHPLEGKKESIKEEKEKGKGRDIGEFVRTEHSKRMGRDFYRFLGLRDNANYSDIDKTGKKLLKTYNRIKKAKRVFDDDERKLNELLQGTAMVLKNLLDPSLREEYNSRKRQGRPPLVTPIKIADMPKMKKGAKDLPKAAPKAPPKYLDMFKSGKWKEAYFALRQLREENSDDPKILSDYGWAIWKHKKDAKEAEDYIRLAITFNNRFIQAYRYMVEIFISQQDHEMAQKFLTILVKLAPDDQKAKSQLAKLQEPQEEKPSKGRFW